MQIARSTLFAPAAPATLPAHAAAAAPYAFELDQ
jgi:hypothetical protein